MRRFLALLKCIGIFLFIGILTRIDLGAVVRHYKEVETVPLLGALIALLGVLMLKALRWHMFAQAAGANRRWVISWKEYMIGVFLSTFTPAKLGDFGKVAYLKEDGVGAKTGALLIIMERVADFIILLPFTAISAAILAQNRGLGIGLLAALALFLGVILVARYWSGLALSIRYCITHRALFKVLLSTLAAWVLHFVWAIWIAKSLGIETAIPMLFAALTAASILSALPIAPSGLGTREAALLAILIPHGAQAERIVALSTMMLLQLIILAILGGWYWIRGIKKNIHSLPALH